MRELPPDCESPQQENPRILLQERADPNQPTEELAVRVRGHGTVRQGRTNPTGSRPFIHLWLEPAAGAPCEYLWYQWVRVRFAINTEPATATTAPVDNLKFYKKHTIKDFKAATGRLVVLEQWRPDYHNAKGKPTWKARFQRGSTLSGRPFKAYPIPGTTASPNTQTTVALTGIIDAPGFCNREGRKPAPIERLLKNRLRQRTKTKPAAFDAVAVVQVEARSFLTCVRGKRVQCLGRIDWTYTNTAVIGVTWERRTTEKDAGLPTKKKKTWGAKTTALKRCANGLTVTGWRTCQ